MNANEVQYQLNLLLEQLQPIINAYDYQAAVRYMDAREYTLTFEHLCEQLYEFQTPISPVIYDRLESLGLALGYTDMSHWQELQPQVVARA